MITTLEPTRGAFKFTEKPRRQSGVSTATVFSNQPSDDFVDEGWDEILNELSSFRDLSDDWDGDGAVSPSLQLIEMALELGSILRRNCQPAPQRVVAGVNGTVCFEYVGDIFFEIEVVSECQAEVYEDGRRIGRYVAESSLNEI